MKEENARTGKAMLEAEAKRKGYSLNDLLTPESFEKLSKKLVFASTDEMFASVGYGAVSVNQILFKLIDYYKRVVPKAPVAFPGKSGHAPTSSVTVRGMSGLMVRFARCCNPVPGDDIVGFVSRGRGVIVHRKDCPNLKDYDPDRIQPAQWTADTGSEFIVGMRVVADDHDGLVAFVTSEIAAMHLSLTQIVGRLDKNKQAVVDINVRLNKRSDLDLLINHLKRDKRVIDVYRTSN